MENECTSHNFSLFAICLPKLYQNWCKFDKVLTKTILHSFLRHGVDNRASALYTGVSYIGSKCHELWSTNGLKLDRRFHPPFENYACFFIVPSSHTHFRLQNSNKLCQTKGDKWPRCEPNVNAVIEIRSLMSRSPKNILR